MHYNQQKEHLTLAEMPEEERPCEKLIKYGAQSLTKAELIAIIIRTGSRNITALDLSRKILNVFDDDLSVFCEMRIEELQKNLDLKGIGASKACQIMAAIELGRRVKKRNNPIKITGPEDIYHCVVDRIEYLMQEHFLAILLDTKHKVINIETISKGILNASIVHPREVFSVAIKQYAAAIALVHNHPSGDPTPSKEDKDITNRLVESGKILGIPVLDHVIVSENSYVSFKELGLIL